MESLNLDAALRLGDVGISAFPACPETKRPLVRFTVAASRLSRVIERLWQLHPHAVPGINLGGCGLVAFDLDRGHRDDADGVTEFEKLLDRQGELPKCPAVRTPRGGVHLYMRQPAGREPLGNSASRIAPGVDVRGVQGFTIAPGAVMATGEFYEGINGTPDLVEAYAAGEIGDVPDWLADLAERPKGIALRGPSQSSPASGSRRPYGIAILEGEAADLAGVVVGGRNQQLNKAAFVIASKAGAYGWVAEAEAWDALWSACVANGYVTSPASGDGPRCFQRSFYSGWNDGLADPTPPRDRVEVEAEFANRICLKVAK